MPPRQQQKKKIAVADADLSQQSASSDDAGTLMAVVAQHVRVSWEKKKKDKEVKFLQLAKRELIKCNAQRTDQFIHTVEDMNDLYNQMFLEYAAMEDEIRMLWTSIMKEQQNFISLSKQKQIDGAEREREREQDQVKGMALTKTACEDSNRIISSLHVAK